MFLLERFPRSPAQELISHIRQDSKAPLSVDITGFNITVITDMLAWEQKVDRTHWLNNYFKIYFFPMERQKNLHSIAGKYFTSI
jgi:hypothetical protein